MAKRKIRSIYRRFVGKLTDKIIANEVVLKRPVFTAYTVRRAA
jgi:hypothetical protein